MGYLVLFVIILLLAIIPIYIIMNNKKFNTGINYIESELSKANFVFSRKIGHFLPLNATGSFYLYVDDTNKRWVMTSPLNKQIDKIRSFSDLEGFYAFDVTSNNLLDKFTDKVINLTKTAGVPLGKVTLGLFGGAVGYATARTLDGWRVDGLGFVIGAAGGYAGAKSAGALGGKLMEHGADRLSRSRESTSGMYGLAMQTTDLAGKDEELVFNFLRLPGKGIQMMDRNGRIYKKDFETIKEMTRALESICKSK